MLAGPLWGKTFLFQLVLLVPLVLLAPLVLPAPPVLLTRLVVRVPIVTGLNCHDLNVLHLDDAARAVAEEKIAENQKQPMYFLHFYFPAPLV